MKALLGSLCSFLNGGTPNRAVDRYYTGAIPWITGADITGPIVTSARSFITEEAIRESATNRVPAGTVLLVTRTSVGKVAVAGMPLCFSQDITALTPDAKRLDAQYLVHFLRLQKPYFERIARGATIKGVTREAVENIATPLPPLSEQRRIAAILDEADALRAKRRAALAQLDTLTQSIFLDMFGDPATNPKGWPVVPLDECVARIQIGPFGSLLHQEDYVEGGIPLVNPKHIQNGTIQPDPAETVSTQKFAELATYHLQPGDVVMGRRGEMGRCAIVNEDSGPLLCGTGSLCIRPGKGTTSLFLLLLLSSAALKSRLERMSLGQTLPNLNSQIVAGLTVPLPPLAVQREFATKVAATRPLIASQDEGATVLNALFGSLQHRAFRGEL